VATAVKTRPGTKSRKRLSRKELSRRAERILLTEPHYVFHPCFDEPGADAEILGPPPERTSQRERTRVTKDADFYVAFLYQTDPLSRDEEFYLFRKMNYLKFRGHRLRQNLDPASVTRRQVEEIERVEREANDLRNFIVESNLRLVTARAKHFARTTGLPLDELISEGNIGLVQAVEHFDFSRGTKLSTYATWAITNKLLAFFHRARRQSNHFVSEQGELLDFVEGNNVDVEEGASHAEIRQVLVGLLANLRERERIAVQNRFGLTPTGETRTLKELAQQWGVTKQRAQQVCAGAVSKLRVMLEQAGVEPPEN
jgi:RNA polymerase sigma factor (sigma-70 family)